MVGRFEPCNTSLLKLEGRGVKEKSGCIVSLQSITWFLCLTAQDLLYVSSFAFTFTLHLHTRFHLLHPLENSFVLAFLHQCDFSNSNLSESIIRRRQNGFAFGRFPAIKGHWRFTVFWGFKVHDRCE